MTARLRILLIVPAVLGMAAVVGLVVASTNDPAPCIEAQSDGPPPEGATAWAKLDPSQRATWRALVATPEYQRLGAEAPPTMEYDLPPGESPEDFWAHQATAAALPWYPWGKVLSESPITPEPPVGGVAALPEVRRCD